MAGELGIVASYLFDEPLGVLMADEDLERVAQRLVGRESAVNHCMDDHRTARGSARASRTPAGSRTTPRRLQAAGPSVALIGYVGVVSPKVLHKGAPDLSTQAAVTLLGAPAELLAGLLIHLGGDDHLR
jgi:hypothetical protein